MTTTNPSWDYWDPESLDTPALRRAHEILSSANASPEEEVNAMITLLDSESTAAQGLAIDHFSTAMMSTRWGQQSIYSGIADRVEARTREHLSQAPLLVETPRYGLMAVNHACALSALRWFPRVDDADLVAGVVSRASDPVTQIDGTRALIACLVTCKRSAPEGLTSPMATTLIDALRRVAAQEDAAIEARSMAIRALSPTWRADIERLMVELSNHDDVRLAASAALPLLRDPSAKYVDHVADLLQKWGPHAAYPANELRNAWLHATKKPEP